MVCATDWLEKLLAKHDIDEGERAHWRNLVERGVRPPQSLLPRVKGSPLLAEILDKLSEPFAHYYRGRR